MIENFDQILDDLSLAGLIKKINSKSMCITNKFWVLLAKHANGHMDCAGDDREWAHHIFALAVKEGFDNNISHESLLKALVVMKSMVILDLEKDNKELRWLYHYLK